MPVLSVGQEAPLEEGIAAPSSTLAWRIPWTEEPGGLRSMGSQSRTRLSTQRLFDWVLVVAHGSSFLTRD